MPINMVPEKHVKLVEDLLSTAFNYSTDALFLALERKCIQYAMEQKGLRGGLNTKEWMQLAADVRAALERFMNGPAAEIGDCYEWDGVQIDPPIKD